MFFSFPFSVRKKRRLKLFDLSKGVIFLERLVHCPKNRNSCVNFYFIFSAELECLDKIGYSVEWSGVVQSVHAQLLQAGIGTYICQVKYY